MKSLVKSAAISAHGSLALPQSGITWGSKLATGFDRLKVGFYIVWDSPLFLESLQDYKLAAKEVNDTVLVSFSEHGDLVFNMHATGRKGGFGFHLSRADVHLFFSTRKDIKTPNLWVDIGSESCWSPGYYHVLEEIKNLVESKGGEIFKNTVSEVHLCADWVGLDIEEVPIDQFKFWVTRANYFNAYQDHGGLQGVSISQDKGDCPAPLTGVEFGRGDIMLRIYNKTAELKHSPAKQGVFASVWGTANYDDKPVTRVEYQLRRPVLAQMNVNSLSDLEEKKNSVWRYCTEDWTSLRCEEIDRSNRHQNRAAIHPWWQEVMQANITLHCEPVKREYPRACKDISTLMDMVGGCLLSACTILDSKSDDLNTAIEFSQTLIKSKLRQMWETKDKHGRREFVHKMEKRWAEIWPMGFEPKPE